MYVDALVNCVAVLAKKCIPATVSEYRLDGLRFCLSDLARMVGCPCSPSTLTGWTSGHP